MPVSEAALSEPQTEPKMSILLVDDRPENLIALESVLSDLGQTLVTARSGMEALKHVLREEFAVILLDVQMPEMDGFETATMIRARAKSSAYAHSVFNGHQQKRYACHARLLGRARWITCSSRSTRMYCGRKWPPLSNCTKRRRN